MSAHITAGGLDVDLRNGWLNALCCCGWRQGPFPDEETAIDALMEHAYAMGRHDQQLDTEKAMRS